jgi:hypothetical protein
VKKPVSKFAFQIQLAALQPGAVGERQRVLPPRGGVRVRAVPAVPNGAGWGPWRGGSCRRRGRGGGGERAAAAVRVIEHEHERQREEKRVKSGEKVRKCGETRKYERMHYIMNTHRDKY